jgi:eukaryotic-like serine/threonine-protein kinase
LWRLLADPFEFDSFPKLAYDDCKFQAFRAGIDYTMTLASGTKLGPYEILAPLGAGGMGEVWRARDTKLNREVALKVLPEVLAQDPERMARFKREAQVLASLNHPNIATIHGFEESGGVRALVMELIEGQTLAEVVGARRGLSPQEALPVAKQIAEALEYAHDRGIVHRDLKPANIKITQDGSVRVLDFGLAKALDVDPTGSNLSNSPTFSPTLSIAATQAGVILGTAAYMSPEQAKGKSVDRRADIWAFGCVLFEMLSGKRPFEGETVSDTLASVLKTEPEWNALPETTPAPLQGLIRRCLTKDPKQRLQAIGEARIVIEETLSGTAVAPVSTSAGAAMRASPLQSAWRRVLPWGVATFAVVFAVVLAIVHFSKLPVPARPIRSSILPPENASFATLGSQGGGAVISPDGTRLVVPARQGSGRYALWVRPLDSLTLQKLEGTEDARFPFWSADSRYVGFFVQGKLKKIDVAGGPPQSVCDATSGRGGTWSQNDVIVFAPDIYSGLSSVPAAGGTPTPLVPLDKSRHQTTLRWPAFLPDGRHFLYWGGDAGNAAASESNGIYVASTGGKDSKFLFKAGSDALYAPPGYLLFTREQSLMAQPFNAGALKLSGDAFPIAEQVSNPESFQLGFFSASNNGELVYQTGGPSQGQILSLDANGKPLGPVGDPGAYFYIQLSPDGQRLAEVLVDAQTKTTDIWLVDLARGVRTRFTFDPKDDDTPVFSPDGSRIAFSSDRNGPSDIFVKDSSGAGTDQLLLKSEDDKFPTDWSRDGKFLSFTQLGNKGKRSADLWILPLTGDKKPYPFLQTEFNEGDGVFSPDGHWLAYESDESGKTEIYVAPFAGTGTPAAGGSGVQGGKWQISQGGGQLATWSHDGRSLYFLAPDNKLMQAEINFKGSAIEVGIPRQVFEASFISAGPGSRIFDVAPNGQRFYAITTKETAPVPLTLVANWAAKLSK